MSDEASKNPRQSKVSCDGCRSRKIKCDSPNPSAGEPCSKCIDAEMQCTFTYKRKKRKPKIAMYQSNTKGVPSAKALIDQVLTSPDSYIPPPDSATIRDIIVSLAKYARSIEESLARSRILPSDPDSSFHRSDSSRQTESAFSDTNDTSGEYSSDERDHVDESFKQLSLGHSNERYFGESSNFRFVYNIINLDKLEKIPFDMARLKRPEYWGLEIWQLQSSVFTTSAHYTFPASDLLWKLIGIYFNHTLIPLLHRPTFERAVTLGLHLLDGNFGGVVLAVCAIAARNCDDHRVLLLDTKLTLGWQWFRQIRLVRSSFIEPSSTFELQLYCLAYIYLEQTNLWDSAWPLVGLGLRLSVDRGIHRLKLSNARTVESELCIRAFWNLRSADIIQGLTLGRPSAIRSEEFDLDRPCECDDIYWEKTEQHEAFMQPVANPLLSFCAHYHKLMDIAAAVQKIIYCLTEPKRKQQKMMVQDSALNDWLISVPNHLIWDPHQPNETLLIQSAILNATYYWVQVQMHKGCSLRRCSSAQQTYRSLAICALAARSTIRVGQVLCRRFPSHLTDIAIPLVQAVTVLLLILWKYKHGIEPGPTADIRTIASDLEVSLHLLEVAEMKSQRIGRIKDKWKAFILAEDLLSGIPAESTSTSKRQREEDSNSEGFRPSEKRSVHSSQSSSPFRHLSSFATPWTCPDTGPVLDTKGLYGVGPNIYQGPALYGNESDHFVDCQITEGFSALGSKVNQDESSLAQYDWDSFMENVDQVLLSMGLN